jgi:hypothetical protein
MNDPWKFVAFAFAAVSGYLSSSIVTSIATQSYGLPEVPGNILMIAVLGLATGFLVDELIPTYLNRARGGGSGGGDFDGGGGGDDLDFG